MDENDFLEAMLSYETLDQARRAAKEEERKRDSSTEHTPRKRTQQAEGKSGRNKHLKQTNTRGRFEKKFCHICKNAGGKYWTHNTAECSFRDKAEKKEANAMESMQKQMSEMKDLVKGLKMRLNNNDDSD